MVRAPRPDGLRAIRSQVSVGLLGYVSLRAPSEPRLRRKRKLGASDEPTQLVGAAVAPVPLRSRNPALPLEGLVLEMKASTRVGASDQFELGVCYR